jgi:type IV secretory pathway TrbD component
VTEARRNPVFKAMNRPLTILSAERRLFFAALVLGSAVFNLLHSLLGGVLLFAVCLVAAQWSTRRDPELLRIVINASKFKSIYDPAKSTGERVLVRARA